MRPYPIFMNLSDRPCLVVGGGAVGRRKAATLRKCGAKVTLIDRNFRAADLDGMTLVIAATNDPKVNGRIASAARRRNIPVNVVDAPDLCDFIVPAIARRGPFTIAVSSGGTSPTAAKIARDRAAAALPDGFLAATRKCARLRPRLKSTCPDPKARQSHYERMLEPWNV